MSRVADSGGSSNPVEVEFESIHASVSTMRTVASEIASLKHDFVGFEGGVSTSDWSTEPSCMAFGESYKAALSVYANVLSGMHADLANFADALAAASKSYEQSDANATAALTKLGAVDDKGFQQDAQGRTSYEQAGHHGNLDSKNPTQATDTTPHDQAKTTLPGAPATGGSDKTGAPAAGTGGSGGSGGAGQSTQPPTSANR